MERPTASAANKAGAPSPKAAGSDRPRGGLAALCVAQTTSWGLLYYSLPVAVKPISADTGWSDASITSAFSAGLIISALAGIRVGKRLDTHGPRAIMTTGAVVGVIALALVGTAQNFGMFAAAWLVAGFAQAAIFYPPAFTVITRWYGPQRVRHLTTLTLVAGLASTIYAPVTATLIDHYGWRTTYFVLAGLLAAITVPLHFFFLNARWTTLPKAGRGHTRSRLAVRPVVRSRRFIMLQLAMAITTLTLYAVTFNIIPLFTGRGLSYQTAAIALGLIGLGQVLGRICYPLLNNHTSARIRTLTIIPAGAGTLWALALIPGPAWLLIAVALLAGATRGCHTLLQATAVADRWGTQNFGSINGIFTAPMTAASALAPAAGALLAIPLGSYTAMAALMAIGLTLTVLAAART